MKQLLLKKGKIINLEVGLPKVGENDLLIQVNYSFISSGTESSTITSSKKSLFSKALKNINQTSRKVRSTILQHGLVGTVALGMGKFNQHLALGYSCSGVVLEVGKNVSGFLPGDFVAAAGSSANHAEIISVPKNLVVRLCSDSFLAESSICAIGAIALQGIRRANLQLGEVVCVIGLGLIGLLTIQLAKLAGCIVIGVDINQERLLLAAELGCDLVFNSSELNIKNEINFTTFQMGVDVTIITAASSEGSLIDQAMTITRRKGKVVLVGDVKLDFSRDEIYAKEIDFLISSSYGPGRYDNSYEQHGVDYPYAYVRWTEQRNMAFFIKLIEDKKINIEKIISQKIEFNQAEIAYESLLTKKSLGIILRYNAEKNHETFLSTKPLNDNDNLALSATYLPQEKLNLAFIGVGGFSKIKLLPLVAMAQDVKIHTIVDDSSANAATVAAQYGADLAVGGIEEIIKNESINAVVIATPHKFHAEYALKCLKAGKAVFLEKPAAISREELSKLSNFFSINQHSLYCVDFNRSFSPLVELIVPWIKKRSSPIIINYRMNAGFIPKDHWVQSAEHGGRIIGEACHIFELFCFLVNSKPKSVSVSTVADISDAVFSSDNFVANISFDDGSVCLLTYTSIGNNKMDKERMEIFFDGKSIVLDDYQKLYGFGMPLSFNKEMKQDKGHQNLLNRFLISAQTNAQWPIPLSRIVATTEISFIVDHLARTGGGVQKINLEI